MTDSLEQAAQDWAREHAAWQAAVASARRTAALGTGACVVAAVVLPIVAFSLLPTEMLSLLLTVVTFVAFALAAHRVHAWGDEVIDFLLAKEPRDTMGPMRQEAERLRSIQARWEDVLTSLKSESRVAWLAFHEAHAIELANGVLSVAIEGDAREARVLSRQPYPPRLAHAVWEVLGFTVSVTVVPTRSEGE